MENARTFTVRAEWDPEARVWSVTDSDVPGLVAEADSLEELADTLGALVPELIERNAHLLEEPMRGRKPITLIAHQEIAVSAG
jgi:hypothetical protein